MINFLLDRQPARRAATRSFVKAGQLQNIEVPFLRNRGARPRKVISVSVEKRNPLKVPRGANREKSLLVLALPRMLTLLTARQAHN
jgi:hypothetical protein